MIRFLNTTEIRDNINGYSTHWPSRNPRHLNLRSLSSVEPIYRNEPQLTQVNAAQQSTISQPNPTNEMPSRNNRLEAPVAPLKSNTTGDLLLISTPITDITIDLTGGDIIQVLLKDYPVSLSDPNNPIALLDTLNRTYVAQSGLVGTDGPDASSTGRPVYQAEKNQYVIDAPTDISIQTTTQSGLIVTKTFSIDPTRYDVLVTHTIQNTSDTAKLFRLLFN